MTRIEVLDAEGNLAGLFFCSLPATACREHPPAYFADVPGEWCPSGGYEDWSTDGPRAWYNRASNFGEIVQVD